MLCLCHSLVEIRMCVCVCVSASRKCLWNAPSESVPQALSWRVSWAGTATRTSESVFRRHGATHGPGSQPLGVPRAYIQHRVGGVPGVRRRCATACGHRAGGVPGVAMAASSSASGFDRSRSRPRVERMRSRSSAPTVLGRVQRSTEADGEEVQDWGKAGRIGIYTANFGALGSSGCGSDAVTALADLSCVAIAVQEASPAIITSFQQRGRHLSDLRFARPRTEGGDGLLVASSQFLVSELITHAEHSGASGQTGEFSAQLFVTARFTAGLAGRGDVTVGNFHLHRETAKRGLASISFQQWARQMARAILQTGTRVLVGDANMALYVVGEALAQYGGVLAQLVAHHRELSPSTALKCMDDRGLLSSVHHDSCGIWIVGGVHTVKSVSFASQCVWGAMHPALLRERRDGMFKMLTRGYKIGSYKMPPLQAALYQRARAVPDADTVTKVMALWSEHEMQLSSTRAWSWSVDMESLSSQAWVSVANCLPKTGEQMEAVTEVVLWSSIDVDRRSQCVQQATWVHLLGGGGVGTLGSRGPGRYIGPSHLRLAREPRNWAASGTHRASRESKGGARGVADQVGAAGHNQGTLGRRETIGGPPLCGPADSGWERVGPSGTWTVYRACGDTGAEGSGPGRLCDRGHDVVPAVGPERLPLGRPGPLALVGDVGPWAVPER